MTKRETLLSPSYKNDGGSLSRSPSEKQAYDRLFAKIEGKFPHLKRSERVDDPLVSENKSPPQVHLRGHRDVRK